MSDREKTVRIVRVALCGCDDDFAEARSCFRRVATSVQQVVNDFNAVWLRLHYEAGNHLTVRRWMERDIAWAKAPKKERGKREFCPVKPLDKEISRAIYAELREIHPTLGTKVAGLATQKAGKRLAMKASKSAYPKWMRILCGFGEFPSSSNPLPIPFYTSNSKLIVPRNGDNEIDEKGQWKLELRLEGDPDKPRLTKRTMHLKTGGRKLHSIRHALAQLADGRWKFCGSELVQTTRGWEARICYQMPALERASPDPDRTAYLSPAADRPVHLWFGVDRAPFWLRRHGRDVSHVRQSLAVQQKSRREAWEYASSAQRRRGGQKWHRKHQRCSKRYRDFQKTYNQRLASDAVRACISRDFGTLVFYQPTGKRRGRRFLAKAGRIDGWRDNRTWDWFQLKTCLEHACERAGIAFSTRQLG